MEVWDGDVSDGDVPDGAAAPPALGPSTDVCEQDVCEPDARRIARVNGRARRIERGCSMDGDDRGSNEPSDLASGRGASGAVRTADGSWTLHAAADGSGETCHSLSGARTEARRHAEVLLAPYEAAVGSAPAGLRILDVGFGLGLNTAAVMERVAERLDGRPLTVVALEHDRHLLERSLALPAEPDGAFAAHLAPLREALAVALGALASGARRAADRGPAVIEPRAQVRIELWLGDARRWLERTADEGSYQGVLLDPFSPASDGRLWEPPVLARLAALLAPGARIATYSAATRVRAGLAAAGLEVGATPRLGSKAEGTVAARGGRVPQLHPRTARRVARRARELGPPRSIAGPSIDADDAAPA